MRFDFFVVIHHDIKLKFTSFVEKMIEKALCQIERFSFILWCVFNVPQALAIPVEVQG